MYLEVLLEILWTLELLAAGGADEGLQWDVHSDVGSDVVTLLGLGGATVPLAVQLQVTLGLAADVVLAQVMVKQLWLVEHLCTVSPLAAELLGVVLVRVLRRS